MNTRDKPEKNFRQTKKQNTHFSLSVAVDVEGPSAASDDIVAQ
jgi:hypothetical protein